MNETRFSVIILIYNTKIEYIDLAIRSILNQDYQNYEIVMIDDGSNEEVKNYIAQYETDKRFVIHHQENQGMVPASMQGLRLAKGDYIVYVDFDDYIDPHTLSIVNSKIVKYGVDVVMFNHCRFTDSIDKITELEPRFKEGMVDKTEVLRQLCLLQTNTAWSRIGKRELYMGMEDYLNLDLVNGEDVQQSTYVLMNANSFYYTPENLYYYRLIEEHRDYYDVKNLNDTNFMVPVYNMIFKDGKYDELLPVFRTSAANSIVYNAFRMCLWIKDPKERRQLLDKLNDQEVTKLTASIQKPMSPVSTILFYIFSHKRYTLLQMAARLYDMIYGMDII